MKNKILLLILFSSCTLYSITEENIKSIRKELKNYTLEEIEGMKKEIAIDKISLSCQVVGSLNAKYLIICETKDGVEKVVYKKALPVMKEDYESIEKITLFKKAPSVFEYRCVSEYEEARAEKRLRIICFEDECEIALDSFTIKQREKSDITSVNYLPIAGEKTDEKRREEAKALSDEATYFFKNQDFTKAAAIYRKALLIDPSNAVINNNVGYSYMALQQTEKAEKYFLIALAISPFNKAVYKNLLLLYQRSRQEEKYKSVLNALKAIEE